MPKGRGRKMEEGGEGRITFFNPPSSFKIPHLPSKQTNKKGVRMTSFVKKLNDAIKRNNSLLCVGLDPQPRYFPYRITSLYDFNKWIIDQTMNLVCAYKPNFAFYEAHGLAGLEALQQTVEYIGPDIPVILDGKRGDIGNTAQASAKAVFDEWRADAVTVSPYLGENSIGPFLIHKGKMVFVLCHTSNPSAVQIQQFGGQPLYRRVARLAQEWGDSDQIGLVVGATHPQALKQVRYLAPKSWILTPGIGPQGGDLVATVNSGLNNKGNGLIIPVSRAIGTADNPRQVALNLRDRINKLRKGHQKKTKPEDPLSTDITLALYEIGCVKFGNFTLASKEQSPFYIDLRLLASHPDILDMVATAYINLLAPLKFELIAAIPHAGLPIGTAVSLRTGIPLIYPRRQVKGHGTKRAVEGSYRGGEKTVMLDDLISNGDSKIEAIVILKQAGLKVRDVVVLIDREGGGRQELTNCGYRLHAVLTISQIIKILRGKGKITSRQYQQVKNYLQ